MHGAGYVGVIALTTGSSRGGDCTALSVAEICNAQVEILLLSGQSYM